MNFVMESIKNILGENSIGWTQVEKLLKKEKEMIDAIRVRNGNLTVICNRSEMDDFAL
jgi:hypothetical protein